MSIEVIHKCDRCKEVIPDANNSFKAINQFWEVGIVTLCKSNTSGSLNMVNRHLPSNVKIEVCRPCLESIGMLPKEVPKGEKPIVPPTLEERIIEIVEIYMENYGNHN